MIDFSSGTWLSVVRYLEDKQQTLRVKNDDRKLDSTETAYVRGELAMIKELLALRKKSEDQVRMAMPHDPNGWEQSDA